MRAISIYFIEFPFFRRKPAFEALIYKGFLGVGFVIPIPRKGTETNASDVILLKSPSFVIPIPRKGAERRDYDRKDYTCKVLVET